MVRFIFALLAFFAAQPIWAQTDRLPASPTEKEYSNDALKNTIFRLSAPQVVRGPGQDFIDQPVTFVKNGQIFYIYGSNQAGWAAKSSSMTSGYSGSGGHAPCNGTYYTGSVTHDKFCSSLALAFNPDDHRITAVTGHNTDQCGSWPNTAYKNPYDGLWYMLIHNEGPCDYSDGSTDESHSMWTSPTGVPGTWTPMAVAGLSSGTILSSDQNLVHKWIVGVGDCTMIPDDSDKPAYMYAVCGLYSPSSHSDYMQLIARAPIKSMGPGNWFFYHNGCYCAPALNMHYDTATESPAATMFHWVGSYAATEPGTPFAMMTMAYGHIIQPINDPASNGESITGLNLSVSSSFEHPKFETLLPPLLNFDRQDFSGRPLPYDGYFYQILRNDRDGSSILDPSHFNLWYMWSPPNNGLDARYLVTHNITTRTINPEKIKRGYPQVAIQLTTWANSASVGSILPPVLDHLKTSATGGSLTANTYFYKVTALGAAGQTQGSNELSITTSGRTSANTVTWTAVPGAVSYRVYRGTGSGSQNTYYEVQHGYSTGFIDTGETALNGGPPPSNSASSPYFGHLRTTTVNPLAGIITDGTAEVGWASLRVLGYILTACPNSKLVNKCDEIGSQSANVIEECWSGASDDYQLHINTKGTITGSCPSGWTHVRTSGWLYRRPQWFPTVSIYSCLNSHGNYHFSSSDKNCEGQISLSLLGYATKY